MPFRVTGKYWNLNSNQTWMTSNNIVKLTTFSFLNMKELQGFSIQWADAESFSKFLHLLRQEQQLHDGWMAEPQAA